MSDTLVDVPGIGQVSFPAGMSDADIESAIKTKILPQAKGNAQGEELGKDNGNIVDNVMRSLANGMSLGYADELSAGGNAAVNWLGNQVGLGNGRGFSESYNENLAKERAQDKAFSEAHPNVATGANIAGNIATGAAFLPEMGAAAGYGMLGNAAKMGAVGATLGGAQGFGEGEGGFTNRIGNAAVGAGFGGALGAALPIGGQVGRALAESGLGRFVSENVVSPIVGKLADALEAISPKAVPKSAGAAAPEGGQLPVDSLTLRAADALRSTADKTGDVAKQAAVRNLALAMERAKMTPDQAISRLGELGDPAVLADLGPQFRSVAMGAKVLPGETRDLAEKVLTDRDIGTGQRLTNAFTGGADVPSMYEAENFLNANKAQTGADLYGQMRDAGLNTSGEMNEMLQVPAVKNAVQQVQADAANTGTQLSPVDIMHRVKQKLNDVAEAAFSSGKPINKTDVRNLANDWEAAFWRANPAAQAADTGYAHAASLPEALQTGRQFMRTGASDLATEVSPSALTDRFSSATPQQQLAFQTGATNAARDLALQGTNSARSLARRLGPDAPTLTDKIMQVYGPERGAAILRQADAERAFAGTSNALLRGSQTAEKIGDAGEVGNIRANLTSKGGVSERLTEHLNDLLNKVELPNETVLNRIGELTLNPNAKENEEVIDMMRKILAKRAKGTKVHAGALTAGSQQLENP